MAFTAGFETSSAGHPVQPLDLVPHITKFDIHTCYSDVFSPAFSFPFVYLELLMWNALVGLAGQDRIMHRNISAIASAVSGVDQ